MADKEDAIERGHPNRKSSLENILTLKSLVKNLSKQHQQDTNQAAELLEQTQYQQTQCQGLERQLQDLLAQTKQYQTQIQQLEVQRRQVDQLTCDNSQLKAQVQALQQQNEQQGLQLVRLQHQNQVLEVELQSKDTQLEIYLQELQQLEQLKVANLRLKHDLTQHIQFAQYQQQEQHLQQQAQQEDREKLQALQHQYDLAADELHTIMIENHALQNYRQEAQEHFKAQAQQVSQACISNRSVKLLRKQLGTSLQHLRSSLHRVRAPVVEFFQDFLSLLTQFQSPLLQMIQEIECRQQQREEHHQFLTRTYSYQFMNRQLYLQNLWSSRKNCFFQLNTSLTTQYSLSMKATFDHIQAKPEETLAIQDEFFDCALDQPDDPHVVITFTNPLSMKSTKAILSNLFQFVQRHPLYQTADIQLSVGRQESRIIPEKQTIDKVIHLLQQQQCFHCQCLIFRLTLLSSSSPSPTFTFIQISNSIELQDLETVIQSKVVAIYEKLDKKWHPRQYDQPLECNCCEQQLANFAAASLVEKTSRTYVAVDIDESRASEADIIQFCTLFSQLRQFLRQRWRPRFNGTRLAVAKCESIDSMDHHEIRRLLEQSQMSQAVEEFFQKMQSYLSQHELELVGLVEQVTRRPIFRSLNVSDVEAMFTALNFCPQQKEFRRSEQFAAEVIRFVTNEDSQTEVELHQLKQFLQQQPKSDKSAAPAPPSRPPQAHRVRRARRNPTTTEIVPRTKTTRPWK